MELRWMHGWVALLALGPGLLLARDYYVSPAPVGSDAASATGTLEVPFATVGRAAAVLEPGDTCWIRQGVYRETVKPARSGEPGRPITFRGYRGEKAVISGAEVIKGPWTAEKGRIHKAAMPWTMNTQWWHRGAGGDQVFVNGDMVPEARWPNLPPAPGFNPATIAREQLARSATGEVLDAGDAKAKTLASARYTCAGLPGADDALRGAKILFVSGCLWTPMTGTVTASGDGTVTFACKAISDQKTWNNAAYIYHPRENDSFYLWGSMALLDAPGEWIRDEQGMLHLWLPEGGMAEQVEAKRREWAFDLKGRSHIALMDVGIFAAGIDTDAASTHVVIDGLDAKYVSHGTWFDWWWGNPVEHEGLFRAGAIQLRGAESEIRNARVEYSAAAGIVLMGDNSRAINNVVRNVGYSGNGAGISVRGTKAERFTITHNTVHGTGFLQCVDLHNVRNAKVLYNDLSDSARLTTDNGVLFVGGSMEESEIAYNLLHDSHGLGPKDGWEHYYGNPGIYLQDRLINVAVHHNVVWNCKGGISVNGERQDLQEGIVICNNTVLAPLPQWAKARIVNNIAQYAAKPWPAAIDPATNLLYGQGDGARTADPGFSEQFTLRAGSPAVDRGVPVPPWTNGFVGKAPDMGAFEHGKPPWRAGATLPEH